MDAGCRATQEQLPRSASFQYANIKIISGLKTAHAHSGFPAVIPLYYHYQLLS